MAADYVLALDQGTTSSRAIVFDRSARVVAVSQREYPQGYPFPGHVTHDAEDIWSSQLAVAREALDARPRWCRGRSPRSASPTSARRPSSGTAPRGSRWLQPSSGRAASPPSDAPRIRDAGHEARVRALTGLPLDAYFSGPKIAHILDDAPGLRARAEAGELCFGTVDSFLIWRLTGGRVHITDVSNASRTLLFDIARRRWDPWLCELIGVPMSMLPEVRPSSALLAETDPGLFGASLPIAGIGGDQMAATFGQACLTPGMAKNTYGTGAFALLNTGTTAGCLGAWPAHHDPVAAGGERPSRSTPWRGRCSWPGRRSSGCAMASRPSPPAATSKRLAARGDRSSGVVVVPAFVGLGAPHWDPDARGAIVGLTLGSGVEDIALATVDAMAYQVGDVLEADVARGRRRARHPAGRRRCGRQRRAAAVPGRHPGRARGATAGDRDDGARCRLHGWPGDGVLVFAREVAATWQLERRFEPGMEQAERERLVSRWRTRGRARQGLGLEPSRRRAASGVELGRAMDDLAIEQGGEGPQAPQHVGVAGAVERARGQHQQVGLRTGLRDGPGRRCEQNAGRRDRRPGARAPG